MTFKIEPIKSADIKTGLKITVDNGDYEAIQSLMKIYPFIDEAAALKFAIAVVLESNGNLSTKKDNDTIQLHPGEKLLKTDAKQ